MSVTSIISLYQIVHRTFKRKEKKKITG